LDLGRTIELIDHWQRLLEQPAGGVTLAAHPEPNLELLPPDPGPGPP
jgi:hypothetical protein